MTLSNISWLGFAAGLAAIGAALYLLQRLRVRHHQHVVMTTLFWKEAIEQTRARVFRQRFRHPWAYLLFLLIAALMWTGFAGPQLGSKSRRQNYLLLDASARMTFAGRFQSAVDQLQQEVTRLPRDRTTVLLCGAETTMLLAPGESPLLLRERLRNVEPEACPPSFEEPIKQLARAGDSEDQIEVIVVGVSNIDAKFREMLPENVQVTQARGQAESQGQSNLGITQLGLAAAKSGRWNRTDAIVEIYGQAADITSKLSIRIDDQPFQGTIQPLATSSAAGQDGAQLFRLAELPAAGQLLRIELAADDEITVDDQAEIYLPNRPLIKVFSAANVPAAVSQALRSDAAVEIVAAADSANVLITTDAGAASRLPALVLGDDQSDYAFFFNYADDRGSQEVVQDLFHNLGLDQIDAQTLAQVSGRVIRLGGEAAERRRIVVWPSLLSSNFDFTTSSAFPLFIGQSVRWLANQRTAVEYAAAGRPIDSIREPQFAKQVRLTPGGQAFRPPTAGQYQSQQGEPLAASLLDVRVTRDEFAADGPVAERQSSWRFSLATFLGFLCLGLLFFESYLFRKGRLP